MIRFSKVHILLICFVLLLSYAASAENCVLVTDDRRMCYDCAFFDDAWPGDIRDDTFGMAETVSETDLVGTWQFVGGGEIMGYGFRLNADGTG